MGSRAVLKDIQTPPADKIPKGENQSPPSASFDNGLPILLWDASFLVVGYGNVKRY